MNIVDLAIVAILCAVSALMFGGYCLFGEDVAIAGVIIVPLALAAIIFIISFDFMRFGEKEYKDVKESPKQESEFPWSKMEAGHYGPGSQTVSWEEIFGQEESKEGDNKDE